MAKIATPISHLFKVKRYAKLIMEHSDCLECRDDSCNSSLPKQELFHCELQPIHKFTEKDFRYLERLAHNKSDLRLLTFHMASSCDKPYTKKGIFEEGGREYSEKTALKNAETNFKRIRSIFNQRVKLAVENTNYYPTGAYKYITNAGFISRIVKENKIYFLFDIAHARITARNRGIDYERYRDSLPLGKAIQVHLSSFGLRGDRLAFDLHDSPKARELAEVKKLLRSGNLKYLTVEYYKDIRFLIRSLKLLRGLV